MEWLEALLLTKVAVFTLVLGRIGALVATAPLLKMDSAPIVFRSLLAITLSLLVMPLYAHLTYANPWNLLAFGSLLFNEILIGLLLGLGMQVLFSGVQVAGQIVSHMSGMSLAEVSNPEFDGSASVFTEIFHYTTMAAFVAMGGHRMMMQALLDTFQWAPPGQGMLADTYTEMMVGFLSQSFQLGIRAAAPLLIALFLSTLLLGLISRTLPQINVLAVGFGLNSLLTMGAILLTLGSVAWTFQEPIADALLDMQDNVVSIQSTLAE